jgi:type II secretory pathway component GspD/PulD (secretin)
MMLAGLAVWCGLLVSTSWADEPMLDESKSLWFQILMVDGSLADRGSDNVTAEQILALVKEGKADRVARIQLSTMENQPTSLQFGEQVPVVTGRTSMRGRDGAFTESLTYMQKGTLVTLTARIEEGGAILANFTLERTEIVDAKPAEEVDQPGPNSFRGARTVTNQVKNTIRLAPGEPLVVSGRQLSQTEKGTQSWVLVTAKVVDGAGDKQTGKHSSGGGFF